MHTICSKEIGIDDFATSHSLRATMTLLGIEACHGSSIVVFQTGHSDKNILKRYHNLQNGQCINQQHTIFGSKTFILCSKFRIETNSKASKIVCESSKFSSHFEQTYCKLHLKSFSKEALKPRDSTVLISGDDNTKTLVVESGHHQCAFLTPI